jgi:hypothetical protein
MTADNDREQVTVREAGAKGGRARTKALSPAERRAIARRAAEARWGAKVPGIAPAVPAPPVPAEPLTVERVHRWHAEEVAGRNHEFPRWDRDTRAAVGVLLAEVGRLRALLDAGAEQVHGMGREVRALRRQLEDARRDAGAFLRELEQL